MTAILRQIEEMEQTEGRVGHGNEKVGEKRQFRDECDAGGEGTGQGLRGVGGGAGGEKLENKRKKGPSTSWAEAGQAAKLRKKSAQSAHTTAKTANVGNARDQARASIAES